ncbi:MAG TPA: diacylglycerol kinase family protein [Pseudonocardiaceae bacterium]|nr:diacylglycerol kinase family protein [Pseudonocardiaceae bacterium]
MTAQARPSWERRLAAVGALVALAGALAVGIAVLISDPLELVAAVLLIGLAAVAAWAALVRRGARRWLYGTIAVLAVVGAVLLPDLRTYWAILLVIVLCALSALAVRVALGHDLAHRPSSAAVGPARRGTLLMNPRSGGGKVAKFELDQKARELGVTPVLLEPGDDLRALAEQAVADGADVLGMAGGDGSQALVADVASKHGVAFVCIPAGTRNHFALDLGLDRADVVGALAAFGDAAERRIDLAMLGDRVFVNNASLGVYATVVQSPDYRDAKAATVAQRLPDLLGPDADRPDLRFRSDDGTPATSTDVLLVSNGAYRLDHINGFGSRERLDAGRLGIVTVTVDRARDVPALMSAELTGQIARFHGYRSWLEREFVVDSGDPYVEVGVDGEALRLPPPLRFRSLPGALRVRVPLNAPGAPPAAVAPASFPAALVALTHILVGRPAVSTRSSTVRGSHHRAL